MINSYFVEQFKFFFTFEPTEDQFLAMESLGKFLTSGNQNEVFVLRGYAGTGKTSLVGALVRMLDELQQKVVLMAPTGRAAKAIVLMGGGGFEPPKQVAADLQSVPFGHSGIHPYSY